jgi:hypothetical protein
VDLVAGYGAALLKAWKLLARSQIVGKRHVPNGLAALLFGESSPTGDSSDAISKTLVFI